MPQSETREKAREWTTYFDPIQDGKAFLKHKTHQNNTSISYSISNPRIIIASFNYSYKLHQWGVEVKFIVEDDTVALVEEGIGKHNRVQLRSQRRRECAQKGT